MTRIILTAATILLATLSSAFVHHPLGGEVPTTMLHGLLSGIGHPIIGFDHLAFVLAVGLIAAFQSNRLVMPLGFVARQLWKVARADALQPRLTGALVAGVGLVYLIENVEGMIFPGM